MQTEKNLELAQEANVNVSPINPEASDNAASAPEMQPKVIKVGSMLRDVRLQKGIKAPDIAKKLCIRKHYLDAIEESNYEALPPLPYGIGFIRAYANFLGLNGEDVVNLYKKETHSSEPQDMHVLEPQNEASIPGVQYLLISVVAIIVVYACWTFFITDGEQIDEPPVAEQNVAANIQDNGMVVMEEYNFETPQTEEDSDTDSTTADSDNQVTISEDKYVAPTTVEAVSNVPAKASDAVKTSQTDKTKEADTGIPQEGVFVKVLKETWVEVKDADKLYLSKVLHAGNTYKVPEGKGMILSLGNYDGAEVYINGKLTKVARPEKKTNIALDGFLENQH